MGAKYTQHEEAGNTVNTLALKYEKYEKFGKHRRTFEENKKKVKQSRYRPGVAQRVPGS